MTVAALQYQSVTIRYESRGERILSDISFAISPGERVALVGVNGSGKTTLLMACVGLVAHGGEIRVCGIPVSQATLAEIRENKCIIFHSVLTY